MWCVPTLCKAACSYAPGLFCLGCWARTGSDESPPPPAFGGREDPCGVEARPWLGDACGVEARPMWCGTPRYSSTALYGAILSCCRRTTAELRPLLNGAACACACGDARCSAAINFQQLLQVRAGRNFQRTQTRSTGVASGMIFANAYARSKEFHSAKSRCDSDSTRAAHAGRQQGARSVAHGRDAVVPSAPSGAARNQGSIRARRCALGYRP